MAPTPGKTSLSAAFITSLSEEMTIDSDEETACTALLTE